MLIILFPDALRGIVLEETKNVRFIVKYQLIFRWNFNITYDYILQEANELTYGTSLLARPYECLYRLQEYCRTDLPFSVFSVGNLLSVIVTW